MEVVELLKKAMPFINKHEGHDGPVSLHWLIVVKQFTDIPINRGPLQEKIESGLNFTIPVLLQYVISSFMHQEVLFSHKILREINSILTYKKISKV